MRILTFIAHYVPGYRFGGPIRAVEHLTYALGNEFDFAIITLDRDLGETSPFPQVVSGEWRRVGKADVLYLPPEHVGWSCVRRLQAAPHDVLYLNSFFHRKFTLLPLLVHRITRSRARLVIAPRGELASSALAIKPWRKRAFLLASRLTGLFRGAIWQASSAGEFADIEHALAPSLTKGRVVLAPELTSQIASTTATTTSHKRPGELRAIFVGRVARVKNLAFALELFRRATFPVRYDVYGPLEDVSYVRECEALVRSLPPNVVVTFHGSIAPAGIHAAMREADVLLLPTHGENFGHAIVEALGNGCPVIISDQTPWRGLEKAKAGWDLSLGDPDAFLAALNDVAAMGPTEHERLRLGALAYAAANAAPEPVVEQNRRLFQAAAQ
jgi:glycosyltransferase involved in cell wall biosynthesis